jgi:cell volume regulation protein A
VRAGLPVDSLLLTVFALLVVGVVVAGKSERLRVPSSLLFLGIGMAVGDDGLGLIRFDDPALVQNVGVVALLVILFEGGLTTKPRDLRAGGLPGFVLSNVGVFVTAAVVGVTVRWLLGTDWHTALLLGAVVSSTDAAAVFSLLKRAPLPRRLGAILEVESGANDPFAVVLTLGLLAHWQQGSTPRDWLLFGAAQLLGGIAVGAVVGMGGVALLRNVRFASTALYPVLALALGGLGYGLAAQLGGSGFLAVYITGLLIGALVPRQRRVIRDFHTTLANTADIGLFLVLGLLVFPSRLPDVAGPALAVTAVLILLARPAAVAVCLTPFRVPVREQAVVAWAGLRGAVPIVLATFPFTLGYPGGETIFDVVFFVVLVSVLLQGSTVTALVRRLGLATPVPAWGALAESLPLEAGGTQLVELTVSGDLHIAGRRLGDCPTPEGVLLTSVIRDEHVLLPDGSTRLEAGDLLVIAARRPDDALRAISAWARGEPVPS